MMYQGVLKDEGSNIGYLIYFRASFYFQEINPYLRTFRKSAILLRVFFIFHLSTILMDHYKPQQMPSYHFRPLFRWVLKEAG